MPAISELFPKMEPSPCDNCPHFNECKYELKACMAFHRYVNLLTIPNQPIMYTPSKFIYNETMNNKNGVWLSYFLHAAQKLLCNNSVLILLSNGSYAVLSHKSKLLSEYKKSGATIIDSFTQCKTLNEVVNEMDQHIVELKHE